MPVSNEPTERRTNTMKEPLINDDQPPLTERGIRDLQAVTSARAPTEPQAPQGSLRCDGVVGGRPSRADLKTLRDSWRIRAGEAASESDYHRLKYEYTTAERHERTRTAYLDCADQLDRLLASSNERQPTPNDTGQRRPAGRSL